MIPAALSVTCPELRATQPSVVVYRRVTFEQRDDEVIQGPRTAAARPVHGRARPTKATGYARHPSRRGERSGSMPAYARSNADMPWST